jgi:serine-type D-Ala-D-Ala carboxypeptidase (penicillin-binding protein 5/6)
MDRHDGCFTPENVEGQIEQYQQASDQSEANVRMLHDLQHIANDDTHRLVQIRKRLVEHAADNLEREPVPLHRYQNADVVASRPGVRPVKKQSTFLIKLLSGFAAVLVIASMPLLLTLFRTQQEQQGHLNTRTPTGTSVFTPASIIKGKAAFLMDATSGKVLADINGYAHLPMSSLTHIMTAVVAVDNANLDQYTTVEQTALDEVPQGASRAGLQVGDQIQLRELLYALLLPSGDDAAFVIAHAVGGNTQNFVKMMNNEAEQLQLHDTHFSSPYGSSASDEYSSAADLTHLAQYALQLSAFAQVVATPKHTLTATYLNHNYVWSTTNTLLKVYSGMNGIDFGYGTTAGACMVFSAQRNGHLLIGTEFGVQSENMLMTDVKKLLNQGFTD